MLMEIKNHLQEFLITSHGSITKSGRKNRYRFEQKKNHA